MMNGGFKNHVSNSQMQSELSSNSMTRRDALRYLSAGALLSLGIWPGHAAAKNTGDNFNFIVINDTHYMTPECGTWLEEVVKRMKTHEGIEQCLFVGDLVDKAGEEHFGIVRDIFDGLRV